MAQESSLPRAERARLEAVLDRVEDRLRDAEVGVHEIGRPASRDGIAAEGLHEVCSPVPLQPGRQQGIEEGLQHRKWHRADVIERPCHRHDASRADAAVRRLESDDAAQRGGNADRAARIGAQRAEAHVGGNGGRRSARRSTGNAIESPWIAYGPVVGHGRRSAEGELVEVQLAEYHGASLLQTGDDVRVLDGLDTSVGGGDVLVILPAMAGGG